MTVLSKKTYTEEYFPNLKFLNLFIDSTNIRNKYGVDMISCNSKDKGKNNSKISLVVDENRFPFEVQMDEAKKHDARCMESIITKLDSDETLPKSFYLIGDKGYIKTIKYRVGKRNITLIAPCRKNSIYRNTKKESLKIAKRPKIENCFATMKQFRKTENRYEKKACRFLSWVYWSLVITGARVLNDLREGKTTSLLMKT